MSTGNLIRPDDPEWIKNAARPVADADGAAIAALITAFLFPPLGVIFGAVSISQARRKGMQASPVAGWGLALGILFSIIAVIAIIILAVAAAHANACDPSGNPALSYC